jgi:hypothetical protein
MASTALKKITTRAKQIRKKHPGKAWKTAVKEAGREYREGGIGKVKRKKVGAVRKSTSKVRAKKSTKVRGTVGAVHTVAQHLSAAKAGLKEQLAWGLLARDQAKTKTAKRKVAKRLVEVRRKLRAL